MDSPAGLYGAYDNTFQNHSDLGYNDGFSPAHTYGGPAAAGDSPGGAGAGLGQITTTTTARGPNPNIQYASDYNPSNFYVQRSSPTRTIPSIREPSASDYGGFGFRRSPGHGVGGSGDMPSPYPDRGAPYGGGSYNAQQPAHSNIHYERSPHHVSDPRVIRLRNSLRDKDVKLQELLRKIRKTNEKLEQVGVDPLLQTHSTYLPHSFPALFFCVVAVYAKHVQ